MGFILSFSDRFATALSMWPAISFVLTLPIVAYLYHRDGRLRFWSALGAYLIVLYALGLGCFTLYPLPSGEGGLGITYGVAPQFDPLAWIGDIGRDGMTAVMQIAMNVVFFVPLGFIASRAFRRGLGATVRWGFLVSLLIETAQLTGFFWLYPFAYRTFDVCDLAWNTAGSVLGRYLARAAACVAPPAVLDESYLETSPGFVRRCVAFVLDMVLVWAGTLLIWSVAVLVLPGELGARFAESPASGAVPALVFFAVEFCIPLARSGQTPGGAFVRMTCETKRRTRAGRLLFLGARLACLVLAFAFAPLAMPALGIFYLARRCMPYDCIGLVEKDGTRGFGRG